MNRCITTLRRLMLCAASVCAFATAAHAGPVPAFTESYFVPYNGAGNVSVFDATSGSGGWVGSIDQTPPPIVANPLSLVSVVLFQLNKVTQMFSGTFEFTSSNDFDSTIFGVLSGSVFDADILTKGGQFSVDYTITGGTGQFFRAHGFGLAFVDFDPAATFNNYAESGVLVFDVPEPTSLALVACGLLAAGVSRKPGRKKAQPVN